MATVNLGRIKPVFRGAFSNSTAYVIDDIVTSGNETFIAIAATQGNATTDASKWTKLAAKGADGSAGDSFSLANKEIAFKTNAGALDGIPIGTAGQFLKVNSGATGYEFGAIASGLVGFAHSVRGGTTTFNTTSYTSLHSINYTPTDYANNRVLVFAHGAVRQDDTNGAGAFVRLTASGNHSTTFYDDVGIGIDVGEGQNYHNVSILFEDTNLTSNNQVSYTLFGKTDNSGSDFRAQPTLGLTVFEIGV
jgi:hypothetical protein